MKTYQRFVFAIIFVCLALACNKDEDATPEIIVNHVGEKWNIVSVEYTLIDQNLSGGGQLIDIGTATNAGAFYFNNGKGSFDITIKNTNKEDYYGYTETATSVSITDIKQNVSGQDFSQNVIALSGNKTATTMTLSGSITKQSTTGQFSLTGTFVLQKN